jgi:hypothetical protein
MSTRKPSGRLGMPSIRLQTGQGSQGAPQPQACGPSQGRSRWASRIQWQLSRRAQKRIGLASCLVLGGFRFWRRRGWCCCGQGAECLCLAPVHDDRQTVALVTVTIKAAQWAHCSMPCARSSSRARPVSISRCRTLAQVVQCSDRWCSRAWRALG